MTGTEQITRFLDRHPAPDVPRDVSEPEAVFPSALELSREEEEALLDTAFRRMVELEHELGIADVAFLEQHERGGADISRNTDSFFGRRHLYELVYRMEMDWRATSIGGIFAEHNLHIPQVRRIVQQQISRAQNYFFATDPWFSLDPQGRRDQDAADKLDLYAKFKAKQSGVKNTLAKAVELAFIRGEAVVKSGFRRDDDYYETFAEVAIDPETGEPLVANDGDYLFREDEWVEETDPETDEPLPGPLVLKRDPTTAHPGGELVFERRKVRRLVNLFAGAELESVYYTDVLVPRSAPDIQQADCVVHTFEVPAIELAQTYMKRGLTPEEHPRFLELLESVSGGVGSPKSGRDCARREEGETSTGSQAERGEPLVRIGEFYLRLDVNGDGLQENILLVADLENRTPIYYDYLSNVTPGGRRPFHVVRVNPVDGRWHGTSQVKLFYDLQMFVDTLTARWDFSQSQSGSIDIVNKDAIEEGEDLDRIEINGGDTYTLKPNRRPEDFFRRIPLSDIKSDQLRGQIEFIQQVMTTLSGVTNANDAAMANLDTTKLATGVRNIERSGQELFAPLLEHLDSGLADAVRGFLLHTVHHMEEAEVFEFFEGGVRHLDEIRPESVRDIDFHVTMELTRYKGEQELIQGMQSIDLIEKFFALPPEIQEVVTPVFISIGKLYGMKDADHVFVPGVAEPVPPGAPMDSAGALEAIGDSQPAQSEPNL